MSASSTCLCPAFAAAFPTTVLLHSQLLCHCLPFLYLCTQVTTWSSYRLSPLNLVCPWQSISSCSQVPHDYPHRSEKRPGVPRLPNLKGHSAEKQRRCSVCLIYCPGIQIHLTLSSLAWLAESASANDILPALFDPTSAAANKTKEQQRRHYICTLHKVINKSDVVLLVPDARDPAGCCSQLVEEETRRALSQLYD